MLRTSLATLLLYLLLPTSPSASDASAASDDAAARLLGAALVDSEGWEKLEHLTTEIGHRLTGSGQLEDAIEWAHRRMLTEGFDRVWKEPVKVPHWVRGAESAEITSPRPRALNILGLGGSVGTPPEGIEAPVVVVTSFDELEALGRERVAGRIVVYAVPWMGYGKTVQYRGMGASRAAALGAVAALVRSATGHSLSTPHTGAMDYDVDQPRVPAAAITVEDADWFKRMAARGSEVTVRLKMEAKTLADTDSFNLIAEIAGSESPEEIVAMGGHFDSWDVGQGAHDDGAGCIATWQALRIIGKLGLRPRRTIRVVLWTNEENGLAGGDAYREELGDDVRKHVAAIEMDGGSELPTGFGLGVAGLDPKADDPIYEHAFERLREISRSLEAIGAGEIFRGGGGADISPLMKEGVPGLGLRTVGEHYFDWHHTHADTLDKIDPQNFRKATAMLAVMAFALADMPDQLVPSDWEPPPMEEEE